MERTILADMARWNTDKFRKPLVLMGARQVGKTWLAEEFSRLYYPSDTVFVNLMSTRGGVKVSFWRDFGDGMVSARYGNMKTLRKETHDGECRDRDRIICRFAKNDSCGGLPWAGRFAIIPFSNSTSLRSSQRWPPQPAR